MQTFLNENPAIIWTRQASSGLSPFSPLLSVLGSISCDLRICQNGMGGSSNQKQLKLVQLFPIRASLPAYPRPPSPTDRPRTDLTRPQAQSVSVSCRLLFRAPHKNSDRRALQALWPIWGGFALFGVPFNCAASLGNHRFRVYSFDRTEIHPQAIK